LSPDGMFFAYDKEEAFEALVEARKLLREAGAPDGSHRIRAYVLVGYPRDTMDAAEGRLEKAIAAGFMPFAMLYRGPGGEKPRGWSVFQRTWTRPHAVGAAMRRILT